MTQHRTRTAVCSLAGFAGLALGAPPPLEDRSVEMIGGSFGILGPIDFTGIISGPTFILDGADFRESFATDTSGGLVDGFSYAGFDGSMNAHGELIEGELALVRLDLDVTVFLNVFPGEVDFAIIDFGADGIHQFTVKEPGAFVQWQAGGDCTVQLTGFCCSGPIPSGSSIDPGQYTFRVFLPSGQLEWEEGDPPGFLEDSRFGWAHLQITRDTPACGLADLAPPFGVHDFDDVLVFLDAIVSGELAGDTAPPFDEYNFDDVIAFLMAFGNGCP